MIVQSIAAGCTATSFVCPKVGCAASGGQPLYSIDPAAQGRPWSASSSASAPCTGQGPARAAINHINSKAAGPRNAGGGVQGTARRLPLEQKKPCVDSPSVSC